MHADLVLEQTVNQAYSFVGINTRQSVSKLKDSLLKVIQLIAIMSILVTIAQTRLEHKVCLDDPGEPVTHLESHKCAD